MNRHSISWALYLIPLLALSGCNGRTILHGRGSTKHRIVSAAAPKSAPACPTHDLSVWFVKPDAAGLKVVSVSRKLTRGSRLQQAVEELLRGPNPDEEQAGFGTEIPRGTILLGVKQHGDDVELNLSRRFASSGGSTSFLTRLDQLRKTVSEPAGAANVFLSVEGRRLNVEEGEGIEIHQPINR